MHRYIVYKKYSKKRHTTEKTIEHTYIYYINNIQKNDIQQNNYRTYIYIYIYIYIKQY